MDHEEHGMWWYAASKATILFKNLNTDSYAELFFACLVTFILGLVYEIFRIWRRYLAALLKKKSETLPLKSAYGAESDVAQMSETADERQSLQPAEPSMKKVLKDKSNIVQSVLHIIQLFFGYCLMLIFMTMNIYLCLALVLGGGIGYWLGAWKRKAQDTGH